MTSYPLRFQPIFRDYIWGGRRLETVLGKALPDGDIAESWEIVDRDDAQSVVVNGALAKRTLRSVLDQHGEAILGKHHGIPRFPLLFKWLDCNRDLSVQVHPDDARAALLDPPDYGKTEAWVVIDAEPGSKIYAGLREGIDRVALEAAVENGQTALCLNVLDPQQGDCIFIPAGVVHALGSGLLIAEIQQSSDTTYRLFDWNRVDAAGRSRELHIPQGLDATDYAIGPIQPQRPVTTAGSETEELVACDKFILRRIRLGSESSVELPTEDRFHLLAVLSGGFALSGDPDGRLLRRGETALVPASMKSMQLSTKEGTEVLDICLP